MPRSAPRQPIRSQAGGAALMVAAPAFALFAFVLLWQVTDDDRFILLGGIALFMAGAWGFDIGRRMRLPDGWAVMSRDPRAPVLYLRPFFEDDRQIYDAPVGRRRGGVDVAPTIVRSASHERAIARALNRIGPLVAIGRPGQSVAPFGAARIYVGDDVWQETVVKLMRRSAIVILQPEATEGTWWELNVVASTVDLQRVLLLVPDPSLRPLGYGRIRQLTAHVLPVPLPELSQKCDAFMFDAHDRPAPIVLTDRPERALKPFLDQVRALQPASAAA